MATYNPAKSVLLINVQTGTQANGDPVVKTRRYPNLKALASADAVLSVGNTIASLQKNTLVSIQRDQVSTVAG